MSYAAFQRLPHRLGWKHEFIDGTLYLRPQAAVPTVLEPNGRGGKRVEGQSAGESRRCAGAVSTVLEPSHAHGIRRMTTPRYRKWAADYLNDFFQQIRCPWSAASVVGEHNGD